MYDSSPLSNDGYAVQATFLKLDGYPGDTVVDAVEDGLKISACDRHSNPVNMKEYQDKEEYGLDLSTGRVPQIEMAAAEQRVRGDM